MSDSEAQPKVRQGMEDEGPLSFINSLPVPLHKRVWALRALKAKEMHFEVDFYRQLHELERNLVLCCADLRERRRQIVMGDSEPTEDISTELEAKLWLDGPGGNAVASNSNMPAGIPNFWLTIFSNVPLLSDMIQEHDKPILRYLKDVCVIYSSPGEPMSFQLDFCFSPNEYFSNSTLTKTYHLKNEFDSSDLLSFDGPEIICCTGCSIAWYKGRNVTVRLLQKTQKHRSRGIIRTVTKEIPTDSFFNFFNPPKVSVVEKTSDVEDAMILEVDYQIGQFLREQVVPKAVFYYTGEATTHEADEEELEELEYESESEDDESDEYDYDEDAAVEEGCEEDS